MIAVSPMNTVCQGFVKNKDNLVSLDDKDYQSDLDTQMAYWEDLKKEIDKVRSEGYENTDIIDHE